MFTVNEFHTVVHTLILFIPFLQLVQTISVSNELLKSLRFNSIEQPIDSREVPTFLLFFHVHLFFNITLCYLEE